MEGEREEKTEQRINMSYSLSDRRKEIGRKGDDERSLLLEREANEGKRDEQNSGSHTGFVSQGKRLYRQGSGLFEARRRSSSQPTVCTVKVARIDRTVGLSPPLRLTTITSAIVYPLCADEDI